MKRLLVLLAIVFAVNFLIDCALASGVMNIPDPPRPGAVK